MPRLSPDTGSSTTQSPDPRRRFLRDSMTSIGALATGMGWIESGAARAPASHPTEPSRARSAHAPHVQTDIAPTLPDTAPEPAPSAPIDGSLPPLGVVTEERLILSAMVQLDAYHDYAAYQRYQRLLILSGTSATLKFRKFDLYKGGALVPFNSVRYEALIDGKAVASVTVAPGSSRAQFTLNPSLLSPGWHRFQIGGLAPGESNPTYWCYVVNGGTAAVSGFVPVVWGTYERAMAGESRQLTVLAPSTYRPLARPISRRRSYLTPGPSLSRSELNCEQLVPVRFGDIHRPNIDRNGVLSTFDMQTYFWSTLRGAKPNVACLDGPRGVGTVSMTTHLELGTAEPDGVPRNNVYFSDPWRVGKISEDGTITTLAGYRHKGGILSHWEDPANLELVGDWSSMAENRRGFHEIWGFAWDERTLLVNESAARIPSENNEHPHFVGPVMFVADSQRNRIIKLQFSPVKHGPPVVTEFITGLSDPWDIVCNRGVMYVSERQAHRITAFDAATGLRLRVVVQGRPLANVDVNREVRLTGTLDDARLAACVAPEGLYLIDGWLYFASKAQAQVRRVRISDGSIEVVRPIRIDGNSKFAKVAVSDGTFGARGTTFTWTWSNGNFGYPAIHAPDGSELKMWGSGSGGTGNWADLLGYASAGAVGKGRLVTGGMAEGILRVTRTQEGDSAESAAVSRGRMEYFRRGLKLLHGANGFGFFGLPLPFGVSADIDAFLLAQGHTRD